MPAKPAHRVAAFGTAGMLRFRPGELAPGSRSSRDPRSAGKDAGTAMLIGPMDIGRLLHDPGRLAACGG
jgi:hypothetical protein